MRTKDKVVVRRNTQQRELIYHTLKGVCNHPTAQEVHKLVVKKDPKISLATVYRNLGILSSEGRILRLHTKDHDARYDACTDSHAHLFCLQCGQVEDVFDITKVEIDSKQITKSKFKIHYNFLELHGWCAGCQKK